MAVTPVATFISVDAYTVTVFGTFTLSGNYGTSSSNGDTLNLSNLFYQGLQGPSNQVPIEVRISEAPAAGTAASGYLPGFAPGTTQANGVLTLIQRNKPVYPGFCL